MITAGIVIRDFIFAGPKKKSKPPIFRQGRRRRVAALGTVPSTYDPLRAAFYVSWDPNSLASLQKHYRDLDLLIPEALHAISPDGKLQVESDEKLQSWLKTLPTEIPAMPMINNSDGVAWYTEELAALLANVDSRRKLISQILAQLSRAQQSGLVVDFEEVPESSQANFRKFIADLARVLHSAKLKLMVALPAGDFTYDYRHFALHADAIILMNYDQHWPTSAPGPIAGQDWFLRNLENSLAGIPPEKVIVAIANYAYDWTEPKRGVKQVRADSISFQEAIVRALESEVQVDFDPDSLNPNFSYGDEQGRVHRVWLQDAVTAYNQLRSVEQLRVYGTALWRLGSEDPSMWAIWDQANATDEIRARIKTIPPGYDLVLEGAGDTWRILSTPQEGARTFRYDTLSDTFVDEDFSKFPVPYRIDQIGKAEKKVALTFDDGPDPKFTAQILDILKEKKAPAAFFVVGEAANSFPDLLQRIYDEGHEIGNHTYTHPHFDQLSPRRLKIELNVTERQIESRLGIKSTLFRPPFGIDHLPESASEIEQFPLVQDMGFSLVGSWIDPHDWSEHVDFHFANVANASDVIAQNTLEQAQKDKGNIILLHDGGGDRSRTVAALPTLIDQLRAAGFEFVSVSSLLGRTRDQVMPALSSNERWLARLDLLTFNFFHYLRLLIATVFVLGIVLVSGRTLIIGLLALIEKLLPAPKFDPNYHPRVSVLIPAYNEEDAIIETVRSALDADYPDVEVIVVDDGSSDATSERVQETFGNDPRARLIRQSNRGKPVALNNALAQATGDVIVTIDADTAIDPQAIAMLKRHFSDPRVGAVAGNVKVANRERWLTRWQALEYITSQNLEKRALDLLNCISVVPGALGAWRASIIREQGGFSADTVAEDTDLTLAIRRAGWRIAYEEQAIARTQAPETPGALVRQRYRWTFGTMQAIWKHRDTLARWKYGTLGWIAIPSILVFQILLPLFSPVIDLLFLGSLFMWGLAQFRATQILQLWTTQDVERSMVFFLAFLIIDVATCVVAFVLEKEEDWTLLVPLVWQRFYYRQMMYWVLFHYLLRAVQGRAVGWSHVEPQVPTPAGVT
ncbi:MAG: glycosyltransferase [Acidobacteria bacterium]|nr:glycosyltransferase [Acidobacteriota bacterium]